MDPLLIRQNLHRLPPLLLRRRRERVLEHRLVSCRPLLLEVYRPLRYLREQDLIECYPWDPLPLRARRQITLLRRWIMFKQLLFVAQIVEKYRPMELLDCNGDRRVLYLPLLACLRCLTRYSCWQLRLRSYLPLHRLPCRGQAGHRYRCRLLHLEILLLNLK